MGEGMLVKDKLARWIANHLPRRVIYFAVVRARYETTMDKWPGDTAESSATVSAVLSRLHVIMRDGTRID